MKFLKINSDDAFQHLKHKNVFLTGPPGSGKSFLINKFIKWAQDNYYNVAVTASTGIASKIVNGKTLHSWAGIGLGEESKEKLLKRVSEASFKKRAWKKTDILIIDEISMISGELWQTLDYIGKNIRKIDKPFGGIQLIAIGDFFQLPPVKGKMLIDESINFCEYFDIGLYLNNMYRSDDIVLNNMLSTIRDGKQLTNEQNQILFSKINNTEPKYPILVSLRESAKDFNKTKMSELTSEPIKYLANVFCIDNKSTKIVDDSIYENLKKIALTECSAEPIIELKIGVPVIYLINNQANGLVNGSVGTVVGFNNDNPIVQFEFDKIEINRHSFNKKFDGVKEITVCIEQYPLLLAYSLTIHRSQGQTLSQCSILLDSTVWEDGQAYVALSRLKKLDNLTLLKYDPNVFKVSAKVKKFYELFD